MQVVQRLQAAGYQTLWAGGCVRDALMARTPKDYDVATEATPEQVRALFGKQRTLAIGAAFGVISVLGPKSAGPIEVATFRRDGGYSDGRRPDAVEFTNAREDALRRDFTINGMFFDPLKEQVVDFVGGQDDLRSGIVRAIGDPHKRIEEDKLRMLRAVRFAATFDFELEKNTMLAIQQHAESIDVVSGERIGAELRRMFVHPNRHVAAELLRESQLLPQLIDQSELVTAEKHWASAIASMKKLELESFPSAIFLLLEPWFKRVGTRPIVASWKLSNDERDQLKWILKNQDVLARASQLPWSQVQPLFREKVRSGTLATLAVLEAKAASAPAVEFCRERFGWPIEKLDPAPLIDGGDLMELGLKPGPQFKSILDQCRAMQLDDEIRTKAEAIRVARSIRECS